MIAHYGDKFVSFSKAISSNNVIVGYIESVTTWTDWVNHFRLDYWKYDRGGYRLSSVMIAVDDYFEVVK